MITKNDDQLTMARTMYGEARGEGSNGMRAVGHVIKNRADKVSWWGTGISGVALKPWQFSAWNANDPNRAVIAILRPGQGNAVFDEAYRLAGLVIDGTLADNTGGATHYHADYVSPDWKDDTKISAVIGRHTFYAGIA